jgi:hypothetical protein
MIRRTQTGEISRLGWLTGVIEHAIWAVQTGEISRLGRLTGVIEHAIWADSL